MKRGKNEADTIRLNGWKEGDILEGIEGDRADRILITKIGEESFLCKWDYRCKGEYEEECGNTTLSCREWVKVDTVNQQWRGPEDGLPPAGSECELWVSGDRWDAVDVIGEHTDGDVEVVVVWHPTLGYHPATEKTLRPIRTEEEKAVEEMMTYDSAHQWEPREFAEALYRAGYKKG